jgi:hypothetical protein
MSRKTGAQDLAMLISVALFRHRVAHHALVRVIEPVFERTFIHDSYATRKGKGSHAAIRRAQSCLRIKEIDKVANEVMAFQENIKKVCGFLVFPRACHPAPQYGMERNYSAPFSE